MTNAVQLKSVCGYFMINQLPLVMQTEGFQQLPQELKEELGKGRKVDLTATQDTSRNCTLQ